MLKVFQNLKKTKSKAKQHKLFCKLERKILGIVNKVNLSEIKYILNSFAWITRSYIKVI